MSIGIDVARVTSETIRDLEKTIKELSSDNYKKYKYTLGLEEKLTFISGWLCGNVEYKKFDQILEWGNATDALLEKSKLTLC